MNKERISALRVLFEGIWVYSLILWGYIVITVWVYPSTQYLGLSEYVPIPQNLLAVVSFGVSFVFFVLWKYLKR